jgi:hypothetical protein
MSPMRRVLIIQKAYHVRHALIGQTVIDGGKVSINSILREIESHFREYRQLSF